jgi:iron complex transport system ATP-binding protein
MGKLERPEPGRLSARDVTLAYGDTAVVERLSLSIPDGQVTSIIGPNGCGKSTLLRALVRLMSPKAGTVFLDGQSIHQHPTREVARRLGLLAQQSISPDAITVHDLVRRGRYPHQGLFQPPTRADEQIVEQALALAGVDDLRDRSVDELSGGQRQRAWIAMTLAQDTPILLLDEPTTYLDIAHQQEVLALVRRLREQSGRTIVTVLHDVNDAARVSDRIVALRDGEIVAEGRPEEIVTPLLLREVFGISCQIVAHPEDGRPVCIPSSGHARHQAPSDVTVEAPALRAEALSAGYGARSVLQSVTVELPPGRITAIVGPNACGKSTLLRTIARLLPATTGTVWLGERPLSDGSHRDLAQRLALMAQGAVSPPGLSVDDLVATGRYPYQRWYRQWGDADARAVDAALAMTDTAGWRQRPVESLSGGQRQRAWLALTLAQETGTLLLDEPTTFLDIAQQVDMLDLVRQLNQEHGRTVVMVLHDLGQAARYADHLLVMKDGAVVAAGAPAEVLTASLVREVFEIEAHVLPDPTTGAPLVLPGSLTEADTPHPAPGGLVDAVS